jgi:hypothetical protein
MMLKSDDQRSPIERLALITVPVGSKGAELVELSFQCLSLLDVIAAAGESAVAPGAMSMGSSPKATVVIGSDPRSRASASWSRR